MLRLAASHGRKTAVVPSLTGLVPLPRRTLAKHRVVAPCRSARAVLSPCVVSRGAGVQARIAPAIASASRALGSSAAEGSAAPPSSPPFVVRAALVGSTVGLLTPAFATAGVVRIWLRWRPDGPPGTYLYYALSMALFGGIGSLTLETVLPFLVSNGNLVLPFMCSNALAAAAWYGAFDAWLGVKAVAYGDLAHVLQPYLAHLPDKSIVRQLLGAMKLTGPLIGVLTAVTAPYLWPLSIKLFWGEELRQLLLGGDAAWWLTEFAATFLWTVFVPVGALAGMAMHHILAPLLTGQLPGSLAGTPWTQAALPALALVLAASAAYIAFSRVTVEDLHWIERSNPKTGHRQSFNTKTGAWDDGSLRADGAANARLLASQAEWLRMAPARRFLRDGWDQAREQLWGIRPPPRPPLPPSAIKAALVDEEVVQIADKLMRLRHLIDAEGNEPDVARRAELREERERLLSDHVTGEDGAAASKDLGVALRLAEALGASLRLPASEKLRTDDEEVARTRLKEVLCGLELDVANFAVDYERLLGQAIPEERLHGWLGDLADERIAATVALQAAVRQGSAVLVREALERARQCGMKREGALGKAEETLPKLLTRDLHAAVKSRRCEEILTLVRECKAAGVPPAGVAFAEQAATEIQTRARAEVDAAATEGRLGKLKKAVGRAHAQQLSGPWLDKAVVQLKSLQEDHDERSALLILRVTVLSAVFVGIFCSVYH